MADAKIDVKVGAISFVGEGTETWLATQLKIILDAAATLAVPDNHERSADLHSTKGGSAAGSKGTSPQTTLAAYLKARNASSGPDKFLATADWLRIRGATSLTTAAVTKALKDNHQGRLGNPADMLMKNIGKGFCERDGAGFFITPDGLTHLGHPSA